MTAPTIHASAVLAGAHAVLIRGAAGSGKSSLAFAHFKQPRGWMHLHLTCMVASYYMLIGGGVNEVFFRVHALQRIVPDVLNSPIVGRTHFAVQVFFVILIAYFNAALLLRRPRTAQ